MTLGDDPLDDAPWALWPYDLVSMGRIVEALHALAGHPQPADPRQPLAPAIAAARDAILEAARRSCAAVEHGCLDRRIQAPETWRDALRRLRADPNSFPALLRDRDARAALRCAASELGIIETTGTRWLHHVHRSPADLRRVIDFALGRNRWLRDPGARPRHLHLVRFLADLAPIFEELAGRPLRRSVTSATKADDRRPGGAAGPGVRFVRLCLPPLEPDISDEAIAHLIQTTRPKPVPSKRTLRLDR